MGGRTRQEKDERRKVSLEKESEKVGDIYIKDI